jgi:hypothetical protein
MPCWMFGNSDSTIRGLPNDLKTNWIFQKSPFPKFTSKSLSFRTIRIFSSRGSREDIQPGRSSHTMADLESDILT